MGQIDRSEGLVGNTGIKAPVLAATTGNITLTGEQTIDGVTCVTGDRVLVWNQTDPVDNGIWVVDTGEWSRAQDCDGARDLVTGTLVLSADGVTYAGQIFRVTTEGTITIGTTELTFIASALADSANIYWTQQGTDPVTRTVRAKLRESVSILDFLNDDDTVVTGDWDGATGTNNKTGIQKALDTGKSVRVPMSDDGGRFYLGTANSGNFLEFTADGQCIIFEDGCSFVALGNATITNTAAIMAVDGLDNICAITPYFESNINVLTTDDRDAPYGFGLVPNAASVNGFTVINGRFYKCQAPVQMTKVTFGDDKDVNNVSLDYVSDTCFYGLGCSQTGNGVRGNIHVIDAFRPFDVYGCYDHDVQVTNENINRVTRTCQAIIGVGITSQASTDKNTKRLKYRFHTRGSEYNGGSKLLFSSQQAASNPGLTMTDIEVDFDDAGNPGTTSIGWAHMVDSVLQASITGTVFDRFVVKGFAQRALDTTSQGAVGALTQSVKGYADFTNLKVAVAVGGSADPYTLFRGCRPQWLVEALTFTPTIKGVGTAGTGTYTANVQYGFYRKVGNTIIFELQLTWDGLAGSAGAMAVGLGSLGVAFPAANKTGYFAACVISASNLTFSDTLAAGINADESQVRLYTFASGAALTGLALDTSGTVNISGSYETED